MANVELTGNFLATARCLIFADSSTGVWSFNPNTNTLTITAAGGGTGFANPTATVGLTAVNGSATTMMRSDAAPMLSSSIYSSLNVVSTLCYRDSNGNVHANNFESAITGNAATGTITLTNASSRIQTFTSGSGSAIVILPDATTLHVGHTIELDDNASGNLTIQLSGTGTTFLTMLPGSYLVLQCTSISFPAGQWNYYWTNPTTNQGLVQDSIVLSSGVAQLSGDSASPGNSYFYGTNGSGTKGWYASSTVTQSVGANPSATVGLLAVNGSATTFMRSDAAPGLSQAIVPTWTGAHIFTPGSGVAITVNKIAGSNGLVINGTTSETGLVVLNGNASSNFCSIFANSADNTNFLLIYGDGGIQVGAATGGDPGLGKINAAGGFYVNGVNVPAPVSGTFTGTLTGCTTSPTGACYYAISGNVCTLFVAAITGTSNTTAMTITGLPAACQPARTQLLMPPLDSCENGGAVVGTISMEVSAASGTITFLLGNSTTGFGNTLVKGVATGFTVAYLLN